MFLNIIMLAGIGGAAVPLVLHLLNRARYRSVEWGAMMFLFGDDARQRHSARFKQWLLLLIRMALVALLAITLARPLAGAHWNPAAQNTSLTAVILLDCSGSMGYEQNGHSRFDEGREAVRQILATLHRGDEAALITLGNGSRGSITHPTADLQSINDALAGGNFLKPGYGVANMADALRPAADVFDRGSAANRALFIVCDRQALNWDQINQHYASAWRSRMSSPGPAPRFFVIPVGGAETDNLSVNSISVPSAEFIAGQPVEVEVTVHNYGPSGRAALPLILRANGHDFSTTLNVSGKSSATARIPVTLFTPGPQVLTARLESTGMTSDDSLSYSVNVIKPLDILIVSGDRPRPKSLNQADYLKLALMPFAAVGREGKDIASVQIVTPSSNGDWGNFDGKKYRVVILADVPEITPSQARALEQHVYGGGGLLVAPGSLTQIDNLNQMLYRQGAGILPAQLRTPTPADGSAATSILGIELAHPLFRFLKGKPDPIPSAIVGRYFPATPRQSDGHVLASFASGWPFVIEGNFGRGKVLLVTSPLDGDWGTLPMTNFYLPMVQSAVRFLAAHPSRNLRPGEPIVADFDDMGAARLASLRLPSGRVVSIPLLAAGDQFEARYADTFEPGIYWASHGGENLPFVVQPSREESDITPLTAQRWRILSQQLGFRLIEPGATPIDAALTGDRSTRELWPILLAALLFLGVAEIALGKAWSQEAA